MGTILTILFLIALIFFAVYSAILFWQWKRYSTGRYTTPAYMLVYLAVGTLCILGCLISVLVFL